jgi:hypothetical protein
MASCALILDECRPEPAIALEVARLNNTGVIRAGFSEGVLPAEVVVGRSLIAIGFDRLRRLSPAALADLKARVAAGATLHIKGGAASGHRYRLAPFAPGEFTVLDLASSGYWTTSHRALPTALKSEVRHAEHQALAAADLPAIAEPLLKRRNDGSELASIFALGVERGIVIYDLGGDAVPTAATPLRRMLEDPATMHACVGELAAAAIAWKIPARASLYNLVIDDRPIDFDYLNCARLLAFLRHVEYRSPGAHVDFAWTPAYTRPSRRYVEALKAFRSGFVWHGLRRHVDHSAIDDLAAEFAAGRRLVEAVSEAYGVRFQPVMVFPFERDTPGCGAFLKRHGFIAKVQQCAELAVPGATGAMRQVSVARPPDPPLPGFAVLDRVPVESLRREAMVARAALGLPLIAAAHPCDLGLRRLEALRPRSSGTVNYFDPVLQFAEEKNLRAASLEEVAYSAIATN